MQFTATHLTRQLDLIPLETLSEKITIIGAGAIGSWVTLALAKMGFTDLTVWDFDEVSMENMNCQFFRMKDVGLLKTNALTRMIEDFTGHPVNVEHRKYESGAFPGIVISAVDSMEVRKLIWENHKRKAPFTRYIIDPRMGAESALLYVMDPNNPKDIESYEKTLYSNEEAEQERCTAKATMYTANMLAGLVAKAVKDIVTGGNLPRIVNWSIKDNGFQAWRRPE